MFAKVSQICYGNNFLLSKVKICYTNQWLLRKVNGCYGMSMSSIKSPIALERWLLWKQVLAMESKWL
jgi:hypothetical protein